MTFVLSFNVAGNAKDLAKAITLGTSFQTFDDKIRSSILKSRLYFITDDQDKGRMVWPVCGPYGSFDQGPFHCWFIATKDPVTNAPVPIDQFDLLALLMELQNKSQLIASLAKVAIL